MFFFPVFLYFTIPFVLIVTFSRWSVAGPGAVAAAE